MVHLLIRFLAARGRPCPGSAAGWGRLASTTQGITYLYISFLFLGNSSKLSSQVSDIKVPYLEQIFKSKFEMINGEYTMSCWSAVRASRTGDLSIQTHTHHKQGNTAGRLQPRGSQMFNSGALQYTALPSTHLCSHVMALLWLTRATWASSRLLRLRASLMAPEHLRPDLMLCSSGPDHPHGRPGLHRYPARGRGCVCVWVWVRDETVTV